MVMNLCIKDMGPKSHDLFGVIHPSSFRPFNSFIPSFIYDPANPLYDAYMVQAQNIHSSDTSVNLMAFNTTSNRNTIPILKNVPICFLDGPKLILHLPIK